MHTPIPIFGFSLIFVFLEGVVAAVMDGVGIPPMHTFKKMVMKSSGGHDLQGL